MRLPYDVWADELAGSRLHGRRWVRARRPRLRALPYIVFGLTLAALTAALAYLWS